MRVGEEKVIEEALNLRKKGLEVAIYPYGERGHNTELILKKQFGLTPKLTVDNTPNRGMLRFEDVDFPNDYIWLISVINPLSYCEIKDSLIDRKVPFDQIIDVCGNEIDIKIEAEKRQKHYSKVVKNIKSNRVIRIAAYTVYKQTFAADRLFSKAITDDRFIAKIVIVPLKDEKVRVSRYKETREYFVQKYGEENVVDGFDIINDEYIDNAKDFDIIYFSNPYDCLVDRMFQVVRLAQDDMNNLPIYISYGYDIGYYTTIKRLMGLELNYAWRCFVDCEYSMNDYKRYQYLGGTNAILSGYAKMDSLIPVRRKNNSRKKILICSHHSVEGDDLKLSCFLKYKQLIAKLPDLFPMCDFVFRPHPLLFERMISLRYWKEEDRADYLNELSKKKIEYSSEGDYFHIFNECDAIINDCGSFTVEWLFTGKPGCFMWNENLSKNDLTDLMNYCLNQYTIAYSEEDILTFIKNVIDEKCDYYKVSNRDDLLKKVAPNWPNASEDIFNNLVSLLV